MDLSGKCRTKPVTPNAYVILNAIRTGIKGVINDAKVEAMRDGRLGTDPELIKQLDQNEQSRNPCFQAGPGGASMESVFTKVFLKFVGANDLPTEVQTILDIGITAANTCNQPLLNGNGIGAQSRLRVRLLNISAGADVEVRR